MRPLEIGDESRCEFASPVQLASVDGVLLLGAFRPLLQLLEVPEAHELARSLVPEPEAGGAEAGEERDGFDSPEERMGLMASFQVVVENSDAQVMDVMVSDGGREPLEDLGQLVERTPLERRRGILPVLVALPVGVLELVLLVEQLHARRTTHHHDRQLDEQVGTRLKTHPSALAIPRRARFVHITDFRSRELAFAEGNRCRTTNRNTGASTNRTIGLRARSCRKPCRP